MNPRYQFLLIAGAICCVPALAFLLFQGSSQEAPKRAIQEAVWPIGVNGQGYKITLDPSEKPVHADNRPVHFTLHVQGLVKGLPVVSVKMPMGSNTMTAPVTVKRTKKPGDYLLDTSLSMGGDWEVDVQPTPKIQPLSMAFQAAP